MTSIDVFRNASDAVDFQPGEVIFNAGDEGDCMYVVKEGAVDILVGDQVVESVSSGGLIGEMALIDETHRSASAVARERSTLVPVDRRRFEFLVQQTPFFALQVMRVMAARIRGLNERL